MNISLMCAILTGGVIRYQIRDGAFNGDLFISYLQESIVLYFITKPDSILIMDNCRFHYRLSVKRFLIKKCVNFKYLPPYSPQLNPIEECFSVIKERFNKLRFISLTRDDVKIKIRTVLNNFFLDLNPLFDHVMRFESFALSKQHFL
ncbi:hypothetical protein CDIK_3986 [Cucumispora dikerogammari]|nr:hypothetical protein CDIK_3986 [Cucumispora dikerogammari]